MKVISVELAINSNQFRTLKVEIFFCFVFKKADVLFLIIAVIEDVSSKVMYKHTAALPPAGN